MKVLLLGATGGTGVLVLPALVARGHAVRVLARRPDAVRPAPGIEVTAGDALDPAALRQALDGTEAVVSCLGSRPWRSDAVCSRATTDLVAAMVERGPNRLVVVSSVGVKATLPHADVLTRLARATALRGVLADKDVMEDAIISSPLDWTLVRPVGLTNGAATGKARIADDGSIGGGFVSRADVAELVAREVGDRAWSRRAPSIG